MQPLCPRCNLTPTAMTVQIDENTWQDVCATCGAKAEKAGDDVSPIVGTILVNDP